MMPYFGLANLIMVYLLGVLIGATRFGRGPSLLASLLSVAAFDFFFVPPVFTFSVSDTQYLVTFAVMLVVALVISDLATRIRTQAESARDREARTAALYAMSRDLAHARGVAEVLASAVRHVTEVFASEITVLNAIALEALLCTLRSIAAPVPAAIGVQEWGYAMLAPLFGLRARSTCRWSPHAARSESSARARGTRARSMHPTSSTSSRHLRTRRRSPSSVPGWRKRRRRPRSAWRPSGFAARS